MAYLVANEFQLGLDLRKSNLTAPASSFRQLEDCVINNGGEIQKRKAFTLLTTLTDASIIGGLAGDNDKFFVFKKGTASSTPVSIQGPLYSLGIAASPGITRVDSLSAMGVGLCHLRR